MSSPWQRKLEQASLQQRFSRCQTLQWRAHHLENAGAIGRRKIPEILPEILPPFRHQRPYCLRMVLLPIVLCGIHPFAAFCPGPQTPTARNRDSITFFSLSSMIDGCTSLRVSSNWAFPGSGTMALTRSGRRPSALGCQEEPIAVVSSAFGESLVFQMALLFLLEVHGVLESLAANRAKSMAEGGPRKTSSHRSQQTRGQSSN